MQRARAAYATGKTRDVNFRVQQLQNLLRMYEENEADMITALYKDLRKPKPEAKLLEIEVLKSGNNKCLCASHVSKKYIINNAFNDRCSDHDSKL